MSYMIHTDNIYRYELLTAMTFILYIFSSFKLVSDGRFLLKDTFQSNFLFI